LVGDLEKQVQVLPRNGLTEELKLKAMISSVSYICGDKCESVVDVTWECAGYEIRSGSIMYKSVSKYSLWLVKCLLE